MDIYIAIVESTDYDNKGYAFEQIVGCFDDEKTAYETARSYYMKSIDDCDLMTGYRVDIYKLNSKELPVFGSTYWIDEDGVEHEKGE